MTSLIKVDSIQTSSGGTPTASSLGIGGTGKIGQVLSTTKSDTFTASVSSLTDITGLSISITPSSTSSKILVLASVPASTLTGQRFFIGLKRDSTQIAQGDSDGSRARVTSGARLETSEGFMDFSINFLDSPSTTSSVTYQVTGFAQNNTAFYINRTYSDTNSNSNGRGASTITVMEVLA